MGSLRNKEQLEVNLKGKFYHTKCNNANLAEHNIKFIALAQSKKQFEGEAGITYYGKVVVDHINPYVRTVAMRLDDEKNVMLRNVTA